MTLSGHEGTVTGIALSPDGDFLLSNSMDGTCRAWDIRPFVAAAAAGGGDAARCVRVFQGNGYQHGLGKMLLRCCWSCPGASVAPTSVADPMHAVAGRRAPLMVAAGSGGGKRKACVFVWNFGTGE